MGKAWEHPWCEWRLVDARWTDIGGRGPHSNNVQDFIIECSNNSQDTRHSRNQQYLASPSKKLALWFITHEFVVGHLPPTSTKCHSRDTCRCSQALLNHTYGSSVHHCHQCSLGSPHHNGRRMGYTVHYCTSTDSWHMKLQKSSYVTCGSHFQEFILIRKKSYIQYS